MQIFLSSTRAANLIFFLLFPGFFFYQTLIGIGAMPAVIGGYFSPICLAAAPVLVTIYMLEMRNINYFFTVMDGAFWIFFLYVLFVVAVNYALGKEGAVVKYHLLSMFQYLVVFLVFRMANFGERQIRVLALATLLAMTAIIIAMSADGTFYLKQLGESDDADSVATYQGFARSYLVTFIVVMPFIRSLPARLPFYAVGLAALFLNGARSELSALLFSISVIEFVRAKNKSLLLAAIVVLAATAELMIEPLAGLLPHTRSSELLNLSTSHSWEMRSMLSANAFSTIVQHPLLGEYGSYFFIFGNAGSYAHNLLSAWVDLGLPGFVYLLGMLLLPMYWLLKDIFNGGAKKSQEDLLMTFCMLSVVLLLLCTSKSFTYVVIAAAFGRYAQYQSRGEHDQNRSSDNRAYAQ